MTVASDNLARITAALDITTPDGNPDDNPYLLYAGGDDWATYASLHPTPIDALKHYAEARVDLPFRWVVALRTLESVAGDFDLELDPPTPAQILAAVYDRYEITDAEVENNDFPTDSTPSGVVLVEKNRLSAPPFYVTDHASAADAVAYHDDQESAEDWDILEIIDLTTGEPIPEREWRQRHAVEDDALARQRAACIAHLDLLAVDGERPSVDLEDDRIMVRVHDPAIRFVASDFDNCAGPADGPYIAPENDDGSWPLVHEYLAPLVGDDDALAASDLLDAVLGELHGFAYMAAARSIRSLNL